MIKLLQGLAVGMALILPGISAGTAILLLGFYHEFIRDLSRLHLRPYMLQILPAVAGAFLSVKAVGFLLEHYALYLNAFLFGMLVVSVRPVFLYSGTPRWRPLPVMLG